MLEDQEKSAYFYQKYVDLHICLCCCFGLLRGVTVTTRTIERYRMVKKDFSGCHSDNCLTFCIMNRVGLFF